MIRLGSYLNYWHMYVLEEKTIWDWRFELSFKEERSTFWQKSELHFIHLWNSVFLSW